MLNTHIYSNVLLLAVKPLSPQHFLSKRLYLCTTLLRTSLDTSFINEKYSFELSSKETAVSKTKRRFTKRPKFHFHV